MIHLSLTPLYRLPSPLLCWDHPCPSVLDPILPTQCCLTVSDLVLFAAFDSMKYSFLLLAAATSSFLAFLLYHWSCCFQLLCWLLLCANCVSVFKIRGKRWYVGSQGKEVCIPKAGLWVVVTSCGQLSLVDWQPSGCIQWHRSVRMRGQSWSSRAISKHSCDQGGSQIPST